MTPSGEANPPRSTRVTGALALALAMALAVPFGSCAEGAQLRINLAGVGAERCDGIRSGKLSKEDVTSWLQGFWSGLNYVAAASEQKQSPLDTDLMIAEVQKRCRQKPSQVLAAAAWEVFLRVLGSSD